MFSGMSLSKKITVVLRDDVYRALKEKAGGEGISGKINEILIEHFAKTETLFGVMKEPDLVGLRDHEDRCL